jgi:hypothetical protein
MGEILSHDFRFWGKLLIQHLTVGFLLFEGPATERAGGVPLESLPMIGGLDLLARLS